MVQRAIPLLLLVGLVACGGGSSSRSSSGTTAAPVTSGGGGSGGPAPTARTADAVRVADLVRHDVAVGFRLLDPAAAPGDVQVAWSADGGATWAPATPGPGSPGLSGLSTAPAPGSDHAFVWDSRQDLPRFAAGVLLRVQLQGGGEAWSAPFAVDNEAVVPGRLTRWPYVQSTTSTGTIVACRTAGTATVELEYGPTPALGTRFGPTSAGEEHVVTLGGLTPGQRVYYRVVEGGRPLTPRLWFDTAPAAGSGAAVRLIVFGDSGTGSADQLALAARMVREEADLVLHTGDVVYPVGAWFDPVGEYDRKVFTPYRDLLQHAPIYPTIGNHDLYAPAGTPYRNAFFLPTNSDPGYEELYYSFEWGDVLFVAIETYTLFRTPGPQINWLLSRLRQSTHRWKIVFMHVPPYSAGDHGDDPVLQQVLEPIFQNAGVDLVIAGHDHNWERTVPMRTYNSSSTYPGLVHLVTGGGGGELRPVNPNGNTAVAVSTYHYLRATIQGDTFTGEAVDVNGQVLDRFTVRDQ